MTQRTHPNQADEHLRRALTTPSPASRIATEVLDRLTDRDRYDLPIGEHLLPVLIDASRVALDGMPEPVRTQAHSAMYGVLTETFRDGDETCGEYAIRLRDAARRL